MSCIVKFSVIYGDIPSAPAYGVVISQLIRYARACRKYAGFLYRARLLTIRLLEQGYVATGLKSSLQRFYGRYLEPVDRDGVSICIMKTDLTNSNQNLLTIPHLYKAEHQVKINLLGAKIFVTKIFIIPRSEIWQSHETEGCL